MCDLFSVQRPPALIWRRVAVSARSRWQFAVHCLRFVDVFCCCCCWFVLRASLFAGFGFFCSILKLNQPLKVLLHFIYGCFFFIFRFFFVCLSLLRVLFIFTFDKEIDNHSKANFVFSLTAWFQTCSIDRARVLLDSEALIRVLGQFLIMSHSFLNLVSTQKLSNVAFDLHLSYIIVFHEVLSKLSLFWHWDLCLCNL